MSRLLIISSEAFSNDFVLRFHSFEIFRKDKTRKLPLSRVVQVISI